MSKVSYGKDYSYADTRLRGTVVLSGKGRPLYVDKIDSGGNVYGTNLVKGIKETHDLGSLNLTPIKLGLINFKSGVGNAERMPSRYWKQGLAKRNVFTQALSGNSLFNFDPFNQAIIKTMVGDFPSLSRCLNNILNGEREAEAFSRNFYIKDVGGKSLVLNYKRDKVGVCTIMNSDNGGYEVKLNNKSMYLSEVLEESLKNA